MENVKFRGKRKEYDSEWHDSEFKYGYLLNECSIGEVGAGLQSYQYAEVIPETVGQFTGLQDKNGIDIYEGDIIAPYPYKNHANYQLQVIFKNGIFGVKAKKPFMPKFKSLHNCFLNAKKANADYEIIGNIHTE